MPAFDINHYKVDVEADIDDETRLPVALIYNTPQGTFKRTYHFQPSAQSISITAEVQSVLDKFKAAQKRTTVPGAPI